MLKSEYGATADARVQLTLLDRAEPVIRRRITMLQHKLMLLAELIADDQDRLDRVSAVRHELQSRRGLLSATV
jgi:hypothetical protein